jgi:hypothetical protein
MVEVEDRMKASNVRVQMRRRGRRETGKKERERNWKFFYIIL